MTFSSIGREPHACKGFNALKSAAFASNLARIRRPGKGAMANDAPQRD
jgi:hypothetical protein